MGSKAAGSVFWAFLLGLFPVAVQLSSPGCVIYKHREICGLKGLSVEFPCFHPKHFQVIAKSGWSKELHPNMNPQPLKEMPAYSLRMKLLELRNSDCTMKLRDLKKSDASIYYFIYSFRNVTGHNMTCSGGPGVRLHIFASPVSILVEKLVRGQDVPVADWTAVEGQRITLSCVPTCAASVNSNPGYIWYKNRLQLNGSRTNSPVLSLDPISTDDTGSYVCVMIRYKEFPSSAVNITVQERPLNIVMSDEIFGGGSRSDIVPTLTQECDTQSSTDEIFDDCPTSGGKGIFIFAIMLVACVCVGLVIAITVTILVLKVKKNKKNNKKRCAGAVPEPPNTNNDFYIALDINSMSAEYHTLDSVRRCSADETVYENLHQHGKSMKERF